MTEASATMFTQQEIGQTDVDPQYGLKWVKNTFDLQPQWTAEPCFADIEALSRQHLQLSDHARCSVKFFNEGAFNRLYKIETDTDTYLMRVGLPVDPYLKIASEVATMKYVRDHTNVALPSVTAGDLTNQNILGFEWILIDFGPSRTLSSMWRTMSMFAKHDLVKTLAGFQAELFDCSFKEIGNLYFTPRLSAQNGLSLDLGPMVAMTFFWGDRSRRHVPRGPFPNSFHWLDARLQLIFEEQTEILEIEDDPDVIEDAETSQSIVEQLRSILPSLFEQDEDLETSIIFHDDLSMHNILLDDNYKLPFIVDWECVSALPLWRACQFPSFLIGRVRTEAPKIEDYKMDDIYWEHLLEFERWQLRCTFQAEMEELRPQWMEEHRKGAVKRDFELAVHNCDNEFGFKRIQKWLNAYNEGEFISLETLFYN